MNETEKIYYTIFKCPIPQEELDNINNNEYFYGLEAIE